jgi:hypothetical protein
MWTPAPERGWSMTTVVVAYTCELNDEQIRALYDAGMRFGLDLHRMTPAIWASHVLQELGRGILPEALREYRSQLVADDVWDRRVADWVMDILDDDDSASQDGGES